MRRLLDGDVGEVHVDVGNVARVHAEARAAEAREAAAVEVHAQGGEGQHQHVDA